MLPRAAMCRKMPQSSASCAEVLPRSPCSQIQRKIEAEEQRKRDEKARAKAMATALATIGKFAIKKKVGDADQIFGSVTAADVVAAIEQQARARNYARV